jgi:CDP-paratose 2-epimerase
MIHQASGKKPRLSYKDENRIGDHICYYSDLSKLRSHYPDWNLTYSLPQIVDEMVRMMSPK